MPKASRGILVTCDPAIKAILVKLDSDSANSFIVEDLDDEHLVIQESREKEVKRDLEAQLEKNTLHESDLSGSD